MMVNPGIGGRKLPRRAILRMFALSAGIALTACGPVGPPAPRVEPTAASSTVGQQTPQPRRGGTLRIGVISEPPNMDGFIQLSIIRDQLWLFFDKLIDIDQHGVPPPRREASS
jgi:hypothetical protein